MELREKKVNQEELERLLEGKGSEELYRLAGEIRERARHRREAERKEENARRREVRREEKALAAEADESQQGRWLRAMRTNCGQCARCRASKEAHRRGEGELEKFHGPYWYLYSYKPSKNPSTDKAGNVRWGRTSSKYIGRRLSAGLAGEFGYPVGATPEEAGVVIS